MPILFVHSALFLLLICADVLLLLNLLIQAISCVPDTIKKWSIKWNIRIIIGVKEYSLLLVCWLIALVYLFINYYDRSWLTVDPQMSTEQKNNVFQEKWEIEIKIYLLYFFIVLSM